MKKNVKKVGKSSKQLDSKMIISSRIAPSARSTQNTLNVTDATISREELCGSFSVTAASFSLVPPSASYPGLDLNPTNGALFPWMSNVACLYEKYEFTSLEFRLVPGNPTTATGRYYLAFDYDWDDTIATTPAQLMSNYGAVSGPVWDTLTMRVDCAKMNSVVRQRFCADAIRYSDSQRLVYGGFLMIAAISPAATAFDLFVRYTLRLVNPCIPVQGAAATLSATLISNPGTSASSLPLPVLPALTTVVGGQGNVPLFTGSAAPTTGNAYAVPPSAVGAMEFVCRDNVTAATPASYVADTILDCALSDASGAFLGYLSAQPPNIGAVVPGGVDSAATWAVAAGYVKRIFGVDLRTLRVLYPTVAYLIPYLYSTAARTFANINTIAKYKEL